MQPIAYIRTPYRQKFAVPRQPNLVSAAVGDIHFSAEFADPNVLRGIDGFSHVWLLFVFHETASKGWSATVTPPRLGGNERVGVFASRSPYRPNPLGLSVVEKVGVIQNGSDLILRVRGVDLVDGTPILDIKPYLPYADALPNASGGYAATAPGVQSSADNSNTRAPLPLHFSATALQQLAQPVLQALQLQTLIAQVLQQDPRPAQHVRHHDSREYGMLLYDYNVRWRVQTGAVEVLSVDYIDPTLGALPWTPVES
jgi:tRNA (adenine37-N6)-methyltransferase